MVLVAGAVTAFAGCWRPAANEVVVYAALDREFSEPVLQDFERHSGAKVLAVYDVESTKTIGLYQRLVSEGTRPQCDVFWNNEILHSIRLARAGLLEAYLPTRAPHIPKSFRAADGLWHGLAGRARILIVNTERVGEADAPRSILDLADERWRGRVGMAKPLAGTTATHAAVLFATWGDERARDYYRAVQENVAVLSGNKQVAEAVAAGELDWGLTDTDDAIVAIDEGRPVRIVFPDQAPDGLGALLIPNTLCLIRGGPHPEQGRELIEYLLGADVERQLALGRSAQFPLLDDVDVRSRAQREDAVRWMAPDFSAAADAWDQAAEFLRDTFTS